MFDTLKMCCQFVIFNYFIQWNRQTMHNSQLRHQMTTGSRDRQESKKVVLFHLKVRDGPFDIQGGAGIFPRDELFFSLFLHNKLFSSKVNCNKIFFFFGKNTLKSEKCKRKQHTE